MKILIVNYMGWEDTIECIESVFRSTYNNFQIFVIDNSPDEVSVNRIVNWAEGIYDNVKTNYNDLIYPLVAKPLSYIYLCEDDLGKNELEEQIVLVKAKSNNGFAAANNIGLKYINKYCDPEDLIWLLNNDTIIKPNVISKIVHEIQNKNNQISNITLYGMPLLEYYDSSKIQVIGGKYNRFLGLTFDVGSNLDAKNKIDIHKYKIDYPVGASLILKVEFLRNVGYMEEEYFLYFEELDWVSRAKKLNGGFEVLNILGVYHKQGNSTLNKVNNSKSKSEFIDLLVNKNRIKYASKYNKENIFIVYASILITICNRFRRGQFKRGCKIALNTIAE